MSATQTDSLCQGELTDTSQLSVIGDIQADHFIFFFPSEHFRHLFTDIDILLMIAINKFDINKL